MELRRSGFSEPEIRARENQLRQNSTASTATALKGALYPRTDCRGREHRCRRGRLREGNLPDGHAEWRVAPPRSGPARKAWFDGRAAEPNRRTQGAWTWCKKRPSSRTSRMSLRRTRPRPFIWPPAVRRHAPASEAKATGAEDSDSRRGRRSNRPPTNNRSALHFPLDSVKQRLPMDRLENLNRERLS